MQSDNNPVNRRSLCILQLSTADVGGGAEAVALQLFQAYRDRGHASWLAVGLKRTDSDHILVIPNDACRSIWARKWNAVGNLVSPLVGRVRGAWRLRRLLQITIGQPRRWINIQRGKEDFDFPGTWQLLNILPERPEIIHCHNLHGGWIPTRGYFDLRALPWLSQQVPVVLTLHDVWQLTGHCSYSLDCARWKTGCGHCPDLTLYVPLPRDATAYNWQRKQQIYAKSRLFVATPSKWLMDIVEQSMLMPSIVEARVIPNGVNLSFFHPGDKRAERTVLGIPQSARVVLFVANGIKRNIWKDYHTLRNAIALVGGHLCDQPLLLIAVGENAPAEQIGQAQIRFVPFQKDPAILARYYRASDLYVHSARAENFPTTILEALACARPVVATAVGGIPEQLKGLRIGGLISRNGDWNEYEVDQATGVLVPPADAESMAAAMIRLLTDDVLRQRLGRNAAHDARQRFDQNAQVTAYLQWYEEIVERWKAEHSAPVQ